MVCVCVVSPDNVNLCQAVSKVLATARRAKGLDVQLRLLAKCQRELLLQLEAQREATARAERAAQQLQVRLQGAYEAVVAQHGGRICRLCLLHPHTAMPSRVHHTPASTQCDMQYESALHNLMFSAAA